MMKTKTIWGFDSLTICEGCRRDFPKDVEPSENFRSIISFLERDKLKWHLRYDSKTIRLRFGLVVEENGKCYVSFLRGSPAYRVAKFTEILGNSGVDFQIDPVHGYAENGSVVFPWEFDSAEEFEKRTTGFGNMVKGKKRNPIRNPMFR